MAQGYRIIRTGSGEALYRSGSDVYNSRQLIYVRPDQHETFYRGQQTQHTNMPPPWNHRNAITTTYTNNAWLFHETVEAKIARLEIELNDVKRSQQAQQYSQMDTEPHQNHRWYPVNSGQRIANDNIVSIQGHMPIGFNRPHYIEQDSYPPYRHPPPYRPSPPPPYDQIHSLPCSGSPRELQPKQFQNVQQFGSLNRCPNHTQQRHCDHQDEVCRGCNGRTLNSGHSDASCRNCGQDGHPCCIHCVSRNTRGISNNSSRDHQPQEENLKYGIMVEDNSDNNYTEENNLSNQQRNKELGMLVEDDRYNMEAKEVIRRQEKELARYSNTRVEPCQKKPKSNRVEEILTSLVGPSKQYGNLHVNQNGADGIQSEMWHNQHSGGSSSVHCDNEFSTICVESMAVDGGSGDKTANCKRAEDIPTNLIDGETPRNNSASWPMRYKARELISGDVSMTSSSYLSRNTSGNSTEKHSSNLSGNVSGNSSDYNETMKLGMLADMWERKYRSAEKEIQKLRQHMKILRTEQFREDN